MENSSSDIGKRTIKFCFSCDKLINREFEKYESKIRYLKVEIEKLKMINEKLSNTVETLLTERYY